MLMRFADDFVCCFQYHSDVSHFMDALGKRVKKFGLELSPEKTQVVEFTRFETKNSKVFTFLGFDFRWGQSRSGKPLVTMRTSRKKFRAALAAILHWIKKERSKLGTSAIFKKLRQKLQGHYNYYGVSGNFEMVRSFYHETLMIMFKWLNRRSQRKSCNWHGFLEMLRHFKIPRPRIIGYWN